MIKLHFYVVKNKVDCYQSIPWIIIIYMIDIVYGKPCY